MGRGSGDLPRDSDHGFEPMVALAGTSVRQYPADRPPQDTKAWDAQYPRFLGLLRKGVI